MKKNIITIVCCFFLVLTVYTQTIVQEENFEQPFLNSHWRDQGNNASITTADIYQGFSSLEFSSIEQYTTFSKPAVPYYFSFWAKEGDGSSSGKRHGLISLYKWDFSTSQESIILSSSDIPKSTHYGSWSFHEIVIPPFIVSTTNEQLFFKLTFIQYEGVGGFSYNYTTFIDDIIVSDYSIKDYNDSINNVLAGVNDFFDKTFKVYSFQNKINIVSAINQENISVSIVDLSGRVILNQDKNLGKNENITLTSESLSKGIYIVTVSDGRNKFSEKVVIQ